jgi:hypothetical protein
MLSLEEGKNLQWIKGDKAGSVEIISTIDNEWVIFQSGGRISLELIHEFMVDTQEGILDFSVQPIENHVQHEQQSPVRKEHDSALMTLLKKMSKTEEHVLQINIPVKVPTLGMYHVLNDTFEDAEVHEEIKKYVLNQINDKEIKQFVTSSVDEVISKFQAANI